ncbi:Protein CBG13651 [Caenorhabditis briggsae]|uniref:Protein CBG13651 n=1 Tax=Caenorhabditis briggsae TaxID=6238 RepID=A8XIE4_CAEBR|nr:Protein CBG13651 [Caenorhabditis briggsae]CAP32418.2 Protein CBG13651 [Caenorhabditis briggsae]
MVVVIDSRADMAQERILMKKLKKYHIGVLVLSVIAVILLLWAIIATVYNFTGNRHTEHVVLEPRSKSARFRNAAAVADSNFCAEIARNIIIQGGNAVDAAISATFCNGVVLPYATGIGGGDFIVIYLKAEKKCVFLNSRETAPSLATKNMYTSDKESAQFGYQSIGIPGELHGLWTAYKKYGSKVIPWSDLVMPAAQLAKGFPMHQAMFNFLDRITKYKDRAEAQALKNLYTSKFSGEFYKVGEIVANYPLAKLLRVIANSQDPVQLFYNGSIADGIIKEMLANGGIITIDDLRNYETHVTEALYADLGKYRMCGPPPPSSWVITQAIPRIVEMQYRDKKMFNDVEFYHTLIEAQKLAYAPAVLDSGTSQISVVDDDGNAVSLTSSINTAFGSKMLSKYGFIYNNQMDDFSTPGFRNHWGFEPTEANFIVPGRRPMSSMSPTVVFNVENGDLKMVTGGTGGSKIISAVAQTLIRGLLMGQNAAEIEDREDVENAFDVEKLDDVEHVDDVEKLDEVEHKILVQLEKDHNQKMEKTDESLAIVYPITNDGGVYTVASDYRRKSGNSPAGY